MTNSISRELRRRDDPDAPNRFRAAAEKLMAAEVRLGWLRALNFQGSGGLAKLGPIAVVVVAAFVGTQHIGTLITLYLLVAAGLLGVRRPGRPQARHAERARRGRSMLRADRHARRRSRGHDPCEERMKRRSI